MLIYINGEQIDAKDSINLKLLLSELGYQNKKIAVELNEEIIPSRVHNEIQLKEHDRLEIVQAIGGG